MAPTAPIRVTVINRILTVLGAISAGDTYFYTPHKTVEDSEGVDFALAKNGPLYILFLGEGESAIDVVGRETYDETFYPIIRGVVHARSGIITKMLKSNKDVRKAIDTDSKSGAAGSLGALCVQVRIDESPEWFYFEDSMEFAGFDQRIRVQITGDLGDL